jgi:Mg-chelatase subunit ChlD
VLVFVALSLVVLMGLLGLAFDWGRAVVFNMNASQAADAASIAGARVVREGEPTARQQALNVAQVNGVEHGDDWTVTVSFGTTTCNERTVTVTASRSLPTVFMRLLGQDTVRVEERATALAPPLDVVLVLDQSGSLAVAGAFDDLQAAAQTFVENFDRQMDQMGLVSFQVRAADRVDLRSNFEGAIDGEIDDMESAGDTNVQEGLRLAKEEFQSARPRDCSAKAVVFFTDGRPTAFRGTIGGQDRVLGVYANETGELRGYFDDPDAIPMDQRPDPDGCEDADECFGWDEDEVRSESRSLGLQEADGVRSERVHVYSIGLGDQGAQPILQPDMDYLETIANVNGDTDASQPQGKAFFAPSEDELEEIFQEVAEEILRLTF